MSLLEEILPKLKPYVLGWINDVQLSSIGAHDLGGKLHAGTLLDSQAPQFLKTDGSRVLIGNMLVADGITIDGVDISVLGSDFEAHIGNENAHHAAVTVLDSSTIDFSLSGQEISGALIQSGIDHGSISGLGDDDHTQYYNATRHTMAIHTSLGLVLNTVVLTAGNGLTGGGTLAADRTFDIGAGTGISVGADSVAIDQSFSPTWSGNHRFNQTMLAAAITPISTDTYDLGSSSLLWRKGWLSELDAVVFAQNTITLLGGWLLVSKNEGTVNANVLAGDANIDFGTAMTVNDFVLMRAAGQMEYMQVTAFVSGTTYTVTRNLDGSGANAWVQGTPWVNLGYSGDGRIELNAYDTPRISMLTQGTSYSVQTEQLRMGDLNGNWGYIATSYGLAVGQYAAGKGNITIDPTNGLRLRVHSTDYITLDSNGARIVGILKLDSTFGALAIGNPAPSDYTTGTGMWIYDNGITIISSSVIKMQLTAAGGLAYGSTMQNSISTTNGILFAMPAAYAVGSAVRWSGSSSFVEVYGYVSGTQVVGTLEVLPGGSVTTSVLNLLSGSDGVTVSYNSTTPTSSAISMISSGIISLVGTKIYIPATGTNAAPVVTFSGDPNTGIFYVSSDIFALSAGSVELLRLSGPATSVLVGGTLDMQGHAILNATGMSSVLESQVFG